jgi:hypothetical protein
MKERGHSKGERSKQNIEDIVSKLNSTVLYLAKAKEDIMSSNYSKYDSRNST